MSLLLLRHASAGDPSAWEGDDRLRPLDERGRRQAEALIETLAGFELDRIVSSPYVRCTQTVEPLALARGLSIEEREELGVERIDELPSLLAELEGARAALCTHGELEWLSERTFKKGSVWVLDEQGEPARYLPPPA